MVELTRPLSAGEVSLILGISEETVKELARRNELPCVYERRRPYFTVESLVLCLKRAEGGAA